MGGELSASSTRLLHLRGGAPPGAPRLAASPLSILKPDGFLWEWHHRHRLNAQTYPQRHGDIRLPHLEHLCIAMTLVCIMPSDILKCQVASEVAIRNHQHPG